MLLRPLMLDLFCGAGGASKGFDEAGFDVVGVDHKPQPRYPYLFCQMDAIEALKVLINGGSLEFLDKEAQQNQYIGKGSYIWLREIAAIHTSPPCQGYSSTKALSKGNYPKLIEPVRLLLTQTKKPYIIENVCGSPLYRAVMLCGSMFELNVWRHRLFECPFPVRQPTCNHIEYPCPIDVTGTGGLQKTPRKKPGGGISRKPRNIKEAREAMGNNWMTRMELNQSIPWAYTKYVGTELMRILCPGSE
jgi:DNA (cytosine-5)-methyltransferase 1